MLEISNTFSADGLVRLRRVRGGVLNRIFGVNLDATFMTEDVSIDTDIATITLWGDASELGNWEGSPGQYAVLNVDDGVPDVYDNADSSATTAAERNTFVFHRGDRIEDIRVVRETVVKEFLGSPEWAYTTDIAVVFVLSHGALVVSKMSLDGEMLRVAFADTLEDVQIPPTDSFWRHWNILGTEFRTQREWLSIDEALTGSMR